MENSLKGLLLAAGVLITAMVVNWGFNIAGEAEDTMQMGNDKINQVKQEFVNSDVTMYEGADITGSEVLDAIKKFSTDKMAIVVTNKAGVTVAYGYNISGTEGNYILGSESSATLTNAKDKSHKNYINPIKTFEGKLLYTVNDAIIGIHFTQMQ